MAGSNRGEKLLALVYGLLAKIEVTSSATIVSCAFYCACWRHVDVHPSS